MRAALRTVPALVWASVIFWLSSQSRLAKEVFLFEGIDKVFHAGAYAVLSVFVFLALPRRWRVRTVCALLVSVIYGASDEWHQLGVAGRSCDVLDWWADSMGAMLGLGLWQARVWTALPSRWARYRAGRDRGPSGVGGKSSARRLI